LAGERVIIAGHVPPGIKVGDNNFCESHARDLLKLSLEYSDIIEVQLYGDHSNDEFRMFWSDEPNAHAVSSVLVSAGITPRKHCNPSWRLFQSTETHAVVDFTQYYLPLTKANLEIETSQQLMDMHLHGKHQAVATATVSSWVTQSSFKQYWNVSVQPAGLEKLWERMQVNPDMLEAYVQNMFSQTSGVRNYYDYICDMRYMFNRKNKLCAQKGQLAEEDRPHDLLQRKILYLAEEREHSSKSSKESSLYSSFVDADRQMQSALAFLGFVCVCLASSTMFLALKVMELRQSNGLSVSDAPSRQYLLLER